MRHKWDYSVHGSKVSDILNCGRRVCTTCGEEHKRHAEHWWMRVVGYRWSGDGRAACPGKKQEKKNARRR